MNETESFDTQVRFRERLNLVRCTFERNVLEIGQYLNMHPDCYMAGETARRMRELLDIVREDVDRSEARRKANVGGVG